VRTPPPAASIRVEGLRVALIDRRIHQYADQNLSRREILDHLLAARWPLEQLKPRFSEFPESVFRHPDGVLPTPGAMPSAAPAAVAAAGSGRSVARPGGASAAGKSVAVGDTPVGEGISFQYVPLIQCSFPHADPKEASSFTRKNGWLELTLGTTRPDAGLPYGVPARLLTIYCTSEAVRTNSPEIFLGESVHDFLRRLDVPITRGARGSLSV
jgi:hypothetical protein